MSAKPELKRDWYFTPGAEWILWEEPTTGKCKAFRVILTEAKSFLEWSEDAGFVSGDSDDGDRPGRSKMTPVLTPRRGGLKEVGQLVLQQVARVMHEPPLIAGKPVELPAGFLEFVSDVVGHMLHQKDARPV